ncbi:MAG: hypothetical protein IKH49_03735 [Bacteroidales bacterium]|nr:hypothetical protein [Bacteroidales bacterium]
MKHILTLLLVSSLSVLAFTACQNPACKKYITYEQFGAKGDGVTDDMPAIVAAHQAANEKGLPVKAKSGKTYYIGKTPVYAEIRTDTDFGKASFIIDDVDFDLKNKDKPVFLVLPDKEAFEVEGVNSLKRGQTNLGVSLPCRCLVEVVNQEHKVFIRKGKNQNNGTAQKEVLLVGEDGNIDPSTPVVFDYDTVTTIKAYPIDEPIAIKGGTFSTIANQAESRYNYHNRGITVRRSGTRIEGLTHRITGELDHGAPYTGFIYLEHVADVVVSDCLMTGHKTYITDYSSGGGPVSMGSYNLNANSCAHILWKDCRQTNDIDDKAYWGVYTTNFCKDLQLDNCVFSRFDAHQSATNVQLKNSTFGHQSVRMVGFGTFLIENCEMHGKYLLSLRDDYGSTWDGDIILRNCIMRPYEGDKMACIIGGSNNGSHDFGYECRLPHNIKVEGLLIDDSAITREDYAGPTVLSSFGRKTGAEEPFPFLTDCCVTLSGVTVKSGKPLAPAPNPEAFPGLVVNR